MTRVGVHIEAELSGAGTNLNRYDRDELYNELNLLLKTYFDKLDGGVEAHTAKVKSLVIDYGKLGKKAKPARAPEATPPKPGHPVIVPNALPVPAPGFNPAYPYVTWNSGRTVTKGDE